MPIESYADKLQEISCLTILPVTLEIWLHSLSLSWPHRDPADRVIVATAELHQATILTNDRVITDYYTHTAF